MFSLDGCNFPESTLQATGIIYFGTFYILLPYYMTVCFALNILLAIALVRRVRENQAFAYQLAVLCAKIFENIVFGYYMAVAYWWVGIGGYVAPWFVSNQALMWFTMCLMPPATLIGFFSPLFASIAMTSDRVFSLWKPLVYTKINHKLHKRLALGISVIIILALSCDKYLTYVIVENAPVNGTSLVTYGYKANGDYVNALWGKISASIRTYVRVSLVVALIILNSIMIYLYRARMNRLKKITMATEDKIRARKEANKDLLILSVCQSILTCIDQIPNASGELLRQQSAYWTKCFIVIAPEYTAAIILATSAEFFLLLAVNRKIRTGVPGYRAIYGVVKTVCSKFTNSNQVVPLNDRTSQVGRSQMSGQRSAGPAWLRGDSL